MRMQKYIFFFKLQTASSDLFKKSIHNYIFFSNIKIVFRIRMPDKLLTMDAIQKHIVHEKQKKRHNCLIRAD